MPVELEPVLETLEGHPDYFKEIYVDIEGKYVLNGKIEDHPKVANLKKAYTEDHKKVRTLNDEMKKFSGIDLEHWAKVKDLEEDDLTAFSAWREEKEKAGSGDKLSLTDEEFNKRTERLVKKYETERSALDKQIAELKITNEKTAAELRNDRKRTALLNACTKAGILPGAVEDAMNLGMQVFQVNEEGYLYILDKDGNEALGADLHSLQPEEWLTSLAEKKAHWWPRSSGGGAGGGSGKDFGGIRSKADFNGDAEKIAAWISKHPGKYLDLPDK